MLSKDKSGNNEESHAHVWNPSLMCSYGCSPRARSAVKGSGALLRC